MQLKDTRAKSLLLLVVAMIGKALILLLLKLKELIMATTNQNCNSNGIVELMHEGRYPSSVYITARDRSST